MILHRIGPCRELPLMRLGATQPQCYRAEMYTVGRFLQLVGLAIPPLAIVGELNQRNPSLLLKFLGVAVGIFLLGYLMQHYSGGKAG
jgi:hypothetical protein